MRGITKIPASTKPARPVHNAIAKDCSKSASGFSVRQAAIVYNTGLPTSLQKLVKALMGLPGETADAFGQLKGSAGTIS